MRRMGTWAIGVLLGLGLLAGCGGDEGGEGGNQAADYCTALEDARTEIKALEGGDANSFVTVRDLAGELGESAPDEVADDWKVLNDAFAELEASLKAAGLTLEDLGKIQSGQMPEGVDQQKLQRSMQELQAKMSQVGDDFKRAGDNITKHAKAECNIDLNQ